MHRRCDRHRIDPGVLKKIAKIGCRHDPWMETFADGEFRRVQVAHADNARTLVVCKIANEVRTPVTVSDNTNSNESIRHTTPIRTKASSKPRLLPVPYFSIAVLSS